MKTLSKGMIFLVLALAIGSYPFWPLNLEDIAHISAKPEAGVAHVHPGTAASIDEELDYMVARKLGSLGGWRVFLAAHGNGVYTQSARTEFERLLRAGNASAPAAAEEPNGGSPDATAVAEAARPAAPSPGTEFAALTPVPTPAAAEVSNGASPNAKAVSEAVAPAPPSPGAEVAALTPDEVCKRDGDRLARLRSSPSSDEAQRFAKELGCEDLRPQLLDLMESLGNAASAPAAAQASNLASPDAKAVREAAAPARPLAGTEVAALSPDEVCKRDADRLARLRGDPSSDEAARFANELGC